MGNIGILRITSLALSHTGQKAVNAFLIQGEVLSIEIVQHDESELSRTIKYTLRHPQFTKPDYTEYVPIVDYLTYEHSTYNGQPCIIPKDLYIHV